MGFTFKQSAVKQVSGSVSSTTLAFGSPTTAGSLIVAFCFTSDGTKLSASNGITDSVNTYTLSFNLTTVGTVYGVSGGYVLAGVGGADTVTFHWASSTSSPLVWIAEYAYSGTLTYINGNGAFANDPSNNNGYLDIFLGGALPSIMVGGAALGTNTSGFYVQEGTTRNGDNVSYAFGEQTTNFNITGSDWIMGDFGDGSDTVTGGISAISFSLTPPASSAKDPIFFSMVC